MNDEEGEMVDVLQNDLEEANEKIKHLKARDAKLIKALKKADQQVWTYAGENPKLNAARNTIRKALLLVEEEAKQP